MIRCSVVIPTYNRCESLLRTLDALASQTLPSSEFEVVVVSDGSTDGTVQELQDFLKTGRLELVIIDQTNAGPAAARNAGVSTASSEIIVFTDDDVEPVPCFLERHLSHHATSDNVIVLGPLSPNPEWTSSEPVWIAWEHAQLQNIYNMFKPGGAFVGPYAGFEHFYSGNASLRKKWLTLAGGFSTVYRRQEDTELAARIKKQADVDFVWEFEADGLHHPVRTLESWLKIPVSYGEVDAQRVNAGDLDAEFVASNTKKRNAVTKILGGICSAIPGLATPIANVLCSAAQFCYKLKARKLAFVALSAAYNILYTRSYKATVNSNVRNLSEARS